MKIKGKMGKRKTRDAWITGILFGGAIIAMIGYKITPWSILAFPIAIIVAFYVGAQF